MIRAATVDETGFQKVVHGIKGVVRRLQSPLEIGNGHSDLRSIVTAQTCCQLGSADGGTRGEADGLRVLAQVLARVEETVDPAMQAQGVLVNGGVGELLELVVVFLLLLIGEVFHRLAQEVLELFLGLFGFFKDAPAHFLGNDFIAVWVIHVFLKKLKILFRILILLLKEALPFVFVPSLLVRKLVFVGHH